MAGGIVLTLVVAAVGYGLIAFGAGEQCKSKNEVCDGAIIAGVVVLMTFVLALMEVTKSHY